MTLHAALIVTGLMILGIASGIWIGWLYWGSPAAMLARWEAMQKKQRAPWYIRSSSEPTITRRSHEPIHVDIPASAHPGSDELRGEYDQLTYEQFLERCRLVFGPGADQPGLDADDQAQAG